MKRAIRGMTLKSFILTVILISIIIAFLFTLFNKAHIKQNFQKVEFTKHLVDTTIITQSKYSKQAVWINQLIDDINKLDFDDSSILKQVAVTYWWRAIFSWWWIKWANIEGLADAVYPWNWELTLNIVVKQNFPWVDIPLLLWDDALNGSKDNPKLWWVGKWYIVYSWWVDKYNRLKDKLWKALAGQIRIFTGYLYDDDNDTWSIPWVIIEIKE
jgi:cell division protein FtsB